MEHYQVIIVGAGPIGLACGIEAQKAGLSYVIIEKGTLVNSLYHYPANMTFFSTSDKLEIGGVPFVSNNAKPTRAEALEYYRRVAENYNLLINFYEKIEAIAPDTAGGYEVYSDKQNYRAANIILATGFYDIANKLDIPGEDLPKVTHYYAEPHPYYRQKVIIVGANNSAVDAALETWRKGAEVTMVIREAEIGSRVKYWVRPDIVNRIKEGAIQALFNSTLVEVKPKSVDIKTPDGLVTLENDFVIAATGYQPNFEFLKKIGIDLSDDGKFYPSYNPETQESNLPGLYLAGVICGGMDTHVWFIENSRVHAQSIITEIKRRSAHTSHSPQ
ncbi:MAG: YpdA family putative bacillithiol disulfide reductase [Lewinellaceae bacterium]|nr:YpdA family putative bacillithiol disulfide reductase [Saprospiraceae bacterium]MCB9332557.1 YpdA family putative bacillithiol disulfide reductase [Lewinellaceae bacterium]